jgi:hypothetical protein
MPHRPDEHVRAIVGVEADEVLGSVGFGGIVEDGVECGMGEREEGGKG